MNEEFINLYIEKMRALIHELQSKVLLLETDIQLRTSKMEELTLHNESLSADLSSALEKLAKRVEKIK